MDEFDAAQQAQEVRSVQDRIDKRNRDKELAELMLKKKRTTERLRFEMERNAQGEAVRAAKDVEAQKAKEDVWQEHLEAQHKNLQPAVSRDLERKMDVDAAKGTEGATPESATMSAHMRMILRQTNRQD